MQYYVVMFVQNFEHAFKATLSCDNSEVYDKHNKNVIAMSTKTAKDM